MAKTASKPNPAKRGVVSSAKPAKKTTPKTASISGAKSSSKALSKSSAKPASKPTAKTPAKQSVAQPAKKSTSVSSKTKVSKTVKTIAKTTPAKTKSSTTKATVKTQKPVVAKKSTPAKQSKPAKPVVKPQAKKSPAQKSLVTKPTAKNTSPNKKEVVKQTSKKIVKNIVPTSKKMEKVKPVKQSATPLTKAKAQPVPKSKSEPKTKSKKNASLEQEEVTTLPVEEMPDHESGEGDVVLDDDTMIAQIESEVDSTTNDLSLRQLSSDGSKILPKVLAPPSALTPGSTQKGIEMIAIPTVRRSRSKKDKDVSQLYEVTQSAPKVHKPQLEVVPPSLNDSQSHEPVKPKKNVRYSDKELKEFSTMITTEREKTFDELRMLKDRLEDLTNYEASEETAVYSMHMAEQGSETIEREKTYAQIQRMTDYLRKLEDASKRIEDKSYGICRQCGILIAKERLLAVPITTLSASWKLRQRCPDDGIDRVGK
jgi:DnaK suppressor protein